MRNGAAAVSLDPARAHADHAVATRGKRCIVGDEHERRSTPRGRSNRRSMIARPVASSRLPVGSSAIRIVGRGQSARASATRCCSPPEAARDSDRAGRQGPPLKLGARAFASIAGARELQRRRDVFERGHGRDQMKGLEHDADARFRGTAPAHPRPSPPSLTPSISTSPLSGRSSPAMIISSVDLPEPDAPTMPTASPLRDCQTDAAQDVDAGGPAAEAKSTPRIATAGRTIGGIPENKVALIWALAPSRPGARVCGASRDGFACRRPDDPPRRLGRQPDRRPRLAARQGLSGPAASGASRQGVGCGGHQRRSLRRHRRGRARAVRLGGACGRRCADRRARRQRHAERPPADKTKAALAAILDKARAAHLPTLIAGMRAAPNLGADYDHAFDAIYPALSKPTTFRSIRSSSMAWRATRSSTNRTACIRPPKGSILSSREFAVNRGNPSVEVKM